MPDPGHDSKASNPLVNIGLYGLSRKVVSFGGFCPIIEEVGIEFADTCCESKVKC